MTATIRVDCAACGSVEMPVANARLRLAFDGASPTHVVDFSCPSCGRTGVTVIGERAVRLLLRAGIPLVAAPVDTRTDPAPRPETLPGDRSS